MSEEKIDPVTLAIGEVTSTYIIKVHCTNCDKTATVTLKKGTKLDTRTHVCGKCGCTTLRKVSVS